MAAQIGRPTDDVAADLFKNPKGYSFFQAIRILRKQARDLGKSEEDLFHELIRVRPLLSLSFPGTDLYSIEKSERDGLTRYGITATFLGLYGAGSPLPTHYTEDLLDEASEDRSVTRDFLDVLSNPFYRLFFQVWSRNHWFIKLTEEDAVEFWERLYCFLGLGIESLRQTVPYARRMLRYIGLFTQFPRAAMGLRTLIADAVDVPNVDIIPNAARLVDIPESQRCQLGQQGAYLGMECYLGQEIVDRNTKIKISIGPVGEEKYHDLLPNGKLHAEISAFTNVYLVEPLERDVEIMLKPEEARTAVLGGSTWSFLGYDAWMFSGSTLSGPAVAAFPLTS